MRLIILASSLLSWRTCLFGGLRFKCGCSLCAFLLVYVVACYYWLLVAAFDLTIETCKYLAWLRIVGRGILVGFRRWRWFWLLRGGVRLRDWRRLIMLGLKLLMMVIHRRVSI